jgi:Rps23 Pro-64 3,4-dihydroxylase Tpa1-like proline 4-hydroxylase
LHPRPSSPPKYTYRRKGGTGRGDLSYSSTLPAPPLPQWRGFLVFSMSLNGTSKCIATSTTQMHSSAMDRTQIAALICTRLDQASPAAAASYEASSARIGFFVIDDLLPAELARQIGAAFPAREAMIPKHNLRERKSILAKTASFAALVGEAIYAFQDPQVVARVAAITGVSTLQPDASLYAGGISAMGQGDFLNPHLDNSHDKDRARWRALNLLYYVTPDWPEAGGGNLELWPHGVDRSQTTIHSRFNRLVVMVTHGASWHSVSPVTSSADRKCVSNYYFTPAPMLCSDTFHVTSFRGRPEQRFADAVLRADSFARGTIRRLRPSGLAALTHVNEPA